VGMDGRRGREADSLADLTHRRRIAALADLLCDELQDQPPFPGERRLGHADLLSWSDSDRVLRHAPDYKHSFVERPFVFQLTPNGRSCLDWCTEHLYVSDMSDPADSDQRAGGGSRGRNSRAVD
jgi:hypothetical protein